MIVMSHTAGRKYTMMIPLQDTRVTSRTMPGSRRCNRLADSAKPPAFLDTGSTRRHHHLSNAGVTEHRIGKVANNVNHNEASQTKVKYVHSRALFIQIRQDNPQLEPVEQRYDYQQERRGEDVAGRSRQNFPSDQHLAFVVDFFVDEDTKRMGFTYVRCLSRDASFHV